MGLLYTTLLLPLSRCLRQSTNERLCAGSSGPSSPSSRSGSIPCGRRPRWAASAPEMPVTANDGETMPAWFDIDELNIVSPSNPPPMPTREDEAGMKKSVARVHALIQEELDKGIDADRIVVGGFSQGCVISLLAALSSKEKLGGVMCLSGWLAMANKLEKHGGKLRHPMQEPHAHELPVFWGHGDLDNVVAHSWGEESIADLHKMGFRDVEFFSYPSLEHYMSAQEEKDIAAWPAKRLPPI